MILEFFILFVGLILGGLIWHFTYAWYKEREWTRNNSDEYRMQFPIEDKPTKPKTKMMME